MKENKLTFSSGNDFVDIIFFFVYNFDTQLNVSKFIIYRKFNINVTIYDENKILPRPYYKEKLWNKNEPK